VRVLREVAMCTCRPTSPVLLTWFGKVLIVVVLGPASAWAQLGHSVAGVGPINRSMGGASVAAPIDAAGALYWNPATIGGLGRSEMEFGGELLIPQTTLYSRIGSLAGRTTGNNGVFFLPAFGLVFKPEETSWTYGFGFFQAAAFGVNYPASRTNPVLMPQPPFGLGVGPFNSQYLLYQIAPSVSYQLTDHLAIGLAGNIDLGYLSVDPARFAAPVIVPTPISPTQAVPGLAYPPATHGRVRWGGGFNVGIYYSPESDWSFGAALKSPQWFETYTFNAVSAQGRIIRPGYDLDFPLIASVGTAYQGIDRLLIAADARFLNFRDTDGFGRVGFDAPGALSGLGWQNVFALALGAQYQWTDALALRAGYTFNLNPVGDAVTSFNIASSTIVQHSLSVGASYDVAKALKVSVAYVHYFQNSISGPITTPLGPIPDGSASIDAAADSVLLGASVAF
jgi:long-chain fatty acid transport protein